MKHLPVSFYFLLPILLFFTLFIIGIYAQDENNENVISLKSSPVINSGSFPIGIDINPITNKLYVANQFSNTISVI
ncbi:MAG TPA: hypothetical protein VD694_03405, partial [Nitrososphaeraceae archaeon]|nr:hypothetical protein [Nitrososphaeraceae archaeon]